jgi:hypothetical protein
MTLIPERVSRLQGDTRRKKQRITGWTREGLTVFGLFAILYVALGYHVIIDQHVVVFDATARLAHAFFVLWNAPPKLAAIGFVWAPISTLIFIPFVAFKAMGSSLLALPLCSGLFAALLMTILYRTTVYMGMRWYQRIPIIALFGLNPMILFYAVNGMSETSYLALLSAATLFFVRWYRTNEPHLLALTATTLTIAFLDRYELFAFAVIVAFAVPVTLMLRRRSGLEIEGSVLSFLAPVIYGVGLWVFFNYVILGDPLFWLKNQTPGATNGAQHSTQVVQHIPTGELARRVLDLNYSLFPLVVFVVPCLLVAAALRRNLMALWLALLCCANAVSTFLLIYQSGAQGLMQLRYNMRAMPLVIVGAAWLFYLGRARLTRWLVWAATVAMLALSLPVTWHTMQTYPAQYEENVFVRALSQGGDQEASSSIGSYYVGNEPDRDMARFITQHVPLHEDAILTDDGQTFGVMLASGRPDVFLDRIDKGDAVWKRLLERPHGRVTYILVARFAPGLDEVQRRYPSMLSQALPGSWVVYANSRYVLYGVARRRPHSRLTHFDRAIQVLARGSTSI